MVIKILFSVFLLAIALVSAGYAQNVSTATIKWNSVNTLEANEGQQTEEVTSVITINRSSIDWTEVNGSLRKRFQIIQAVGEWPDANQPGWMQYEVTDGNVSGTIAIKKNQSGIKVFIALASEPPQSYVLSIDSYEAL